VVRAAAPIRAARENPPPVDSLLLGLDRLGAHDARLIAWGVLAFAAILAPVLAWKLARQRADLRDMVSALREATKAGGTLPYIAGARTASARALPADLMAWARRHSHQIQWMRAWTQKQGQEWDSLHEQLSWLAQEHASGPGPGGMEDTLARAAAAMEEALQAALVLTRSLKAGQESGAAAETLDLRDALGRMTRFLAEGAQLLDGAQRRLATGEDGAEWPLERASLIRRMRALASSAAEEHRKMEGDLAKLLEGFLPEEAPPGEESVSAVLDPPPSEPHKPTQDRFANSL